MKWLVGVDEAGRGPLAGPVAVGVAVVPINFNWQLIPKVGDSKQVKPIDREEIFRLATKLKKDGQIDFRVIQTDSKRIDQKGIVPAIESAMARALETLKLEPNECQVLLDGALRAPRQFINQTTIIKGDSLEPVIGLASILAKVTRDRHMLRLSRRIDLAPYRLDLHKGYGTKLHREAIEKYGLSIIHRRSFCRGCLEEKL